MQVNINDIPSTGLHISAEEDVGDLCEEAGADFRALSPISAELSFLKSDDEIFITGELSSTVGLTCSRCLAVFEQKIKSRIENVYTLQPEPEPDIREREIKKGDIDVSRLDTEEINIKMLAFEQLALDIPIQPVCKDDCKGLCPKCGANLNDGQCSCRAEPHLDPRLAKLQEFKK